MISSDLNSLPVSATESLISLILYSFLLMQVYMLTVFTNIFKDFPLSLINSWLSGMDTGKKRKVNMSEVENVRYGVSLLRNRTLRQLVAIQSLTRVLLEANGLPEQIEKLKSRESKLKIIKEDIKIIPNLPELEARQKLLQVEMDLEECKQQLSEVRRQQSEVREKTRKLDQIFLKNEEFSTVTLEKELYSAVPGMKEVAATYDHARLPSREALPPTSSDLDFQIYDNEKGLHGIPLGNTITNGMLQQGGGEASEAQYNKNAPPLLHGDNQMSLMLSGSNKRDGVTDAGVQGTEITVDQDHGSLLAREMLKCNYNSWQSGLFNKDNNKALDKTCYGETPDYLKHIATLIEVDRGKATKFGHKNIEVLVCAAIKEMYDWRTPKDSGWKQLKKWATMLNMSKEQDFEVKFADDMLMNISLACFAYSMIFGEDGSAHKFANGRV
ncbi:hypothetical protein V6Z12_A11G379100 [Gossypium hirsutum]